MGIDTQSVLVSIRSLLNSYPYQNEPGFEETPTHAKPVMKYNQYLRYETLLTAVLRTVTVSMATAHTNRQACLASQVQDSFLDNFEYYMFVCDEYGFLDGRSFADAFSFRSGTFDFAGLKDRLETLYKQVAKVVENREKEDKKEPYSSSK